ncbi:MAG: cobaltochelatase subunit CobN [Leptolyngbya sp. SIO4C5]|nr:cobaltochelatase subunit CobN [Leptolyngbya sp. SIO4C5]
MHRLATTPGGWDPTAEGVIFVEQTPAPVVFLSAADTDIQTLANVLPRLPASFPALRIANLLQLQQQLSIDTYADTVIAAAQVVILRLLGGRAYWSYGLEVVKQTVQQSGAALIVIPGDDRPDIDLMSHSTAPLAVVNQLWQYFTEGGSDNWQWGLQSLSDRYFGTDYKPPSPQTIAKVGLYNWRSSIPTDLQDKQKDWPRAAILFYRSHYLAGNLAPIEALCQALSDRQIQPQPVYISSLQDPDVQAELLSLLQPEAAPGIDLLLNTTSFSVAKLTAALPNLHLWQQLDVPVLQVILSGGTYERWQANPQGLSPRDIAMNVALPEVDGRIITRTASFKAVQQRHPGLETDVVAYEPVGDRIDFIAALAANWIALRTTPPAQRRIALILANYPTRDGRLANGVGLDTPQSCVEILKALQAAGYAIPRLPQSGDELIQWLTATVTNDPEGHHLRPVPQSLTVKTYGQYFQQLSAAVRQGVGERWGNGEDEGKKDEGSKNKHLAAWGDRAAQADQNQKTTANGGKIVSAAASVYPIPGLQLGHVFIGIQPSRGYDQDPSLNYHAPDLAPTHDYLAFYFWLRHQFGAQAMVHVGKHGNLEWLPGKGVGLTCNCYPEAAFGPLPHLYPFIVNDPGEGAQAKRRAQAVILDHLTPPMTRAELYGPLQQLEALVDEYYEAQSLDPNRLPIISDRLLKLLQTTHLLQDPNLAIFQPTSSTAPADAAGDRPSPPMSASTALPQLLPQLDTYLCNLKEAQIRDGLHIFGQCPQARQLRDLIIAIARHPSRDRLGLTRAIAQSWQLDLDPLTADPARPYTPEPAAIARAPLLKNCRTYADVIEQIEHQAAHLIDALLASPFSSPFDSADGQPASALEAELAWIHTQILPRLQQTPQEITHLLHGLSGGYVPSGPAGAPTRNRPDVLPTGRNFYSVDIRAIPTESAWDVGRKAAEVLVEDYVQTNGEYPQTLGLSVWGTATMRTGGDDIAEALALMGVRPVWDGPSRRVVDFEILPLSLLGRPRVDVTLRISGFFRDAFPNLIDLFDQAVSAIASLDEPATQNPLAAQTAQETQFWQRQGLDPQQAEARSRYRIFGSKPGAYGAGLQGLIEAQNWTTDADLARAYINWSSYAYSRQAEGRSAPAAFQQRLGQMQVVLHNQDNREHDLLDSDDYYQFQGGLTAAVRVAQGQNPQVYFGDHALPENPKVRSLRAEIARVYRSRVVNPKWIAGVMRHGYKGAFEMAATVDYLFAYDATARCVEDYMYQGVAQAYVLDSEVQTFVAQKNPWALRDMAERLVEAHQRGLWQQPDANTLDQLRAIAHQAEEIIESS